MDIGVADRATEGVVELDAGATRSGMIGIAGHKLSVDFDILYPAIGNIPGRDGVAACAGQVQMLDARILRSRLLRPGRRSPRGCLEDLGKPGRVEVDMDDAGDGEHGVLSTHGLRGDLDLLAGRAPRAAGDARAGEIDGIIRRAARVGSRGTGACALRLPLVVVPVPKPDVGFILLVDLKDVPGLDGG